MDRDMLRAQAAARTPAYERLETMVAAILRDGRTSGFFGWGFRQSDGGVRVCMEGRFYEARTTRTGWRVEAPDCVGAAPALVDACRLALVGR